MNDVKEMKAEHLYVQSSSGVSLATGSFFLPLLTTTPVMIEVVDPFDLNGGGSVVLRASVELIRVGVEGLLPILAHDAVAGSADPSSSLSSLLLDLSPGAGQSDRDDDAE